MRKTRSQRILNRQKNKVRKEEWKGYEEWKRELWECIAVSKVSQPLVLAIVLYTPTWWYYE